MGNLSAYEVGLDGFRLDDPTPLNEEQLKEIEKAKKNGKMELYFQQLDEIPVQVTISFTNILCSQTFAISRYRSHTLALLLTPPLTHTRSLSCSQTLSHSLLSRFPLTRTHTHTYTTCSLAHSLTFFLTHTCAHAHTSVYTIYTTHSRSHIHSLTHSRSHSHFTDLCAIQYDLLKFIHQLPAMPPHTSMPLTAVSKHPRLDLQRIRIAAQ